jgi:hypothetical protein
LAKPTLLQKLFKLQEILSNKPWEKDGINRHQSYKYITEAQYKANFKAALQEAGLLWRMETVKREYIGNVSDKMHLVLCDFKGTLTDPETGESQEYLFCGSGADNGDKALYKAVTGGLKFFLASNFNVAEANDPESDEHVENKMPATPEKREEIKKDLTAKDGPATPMQIKSLKTILAKLREADPTQEGFITDLAVKTEAFTKITKAQCEKLIIQISDTLTAIEGA